MAKQIKRDLDEPFDVPLKEAAREIGVTPNTLVRRAKKREVSFALKPGGSKPRYYFRLSDVERLASQQRFGEVTVVS